jgi:predicted secreted protein
MGWALGIGFYFVIWWTLFTAVLPWGVRTQNEAGDIVPGSERSAPVTPYLWRKIVANTILSGVVWLIVDLAYIYFYLGR